MSAKPLVTALSAGAALSLLVTVMVALVAIVLAVSGQSAVEVPFLLQARSGSGSDILSLQVNPLGIVTWLVVLAVVLAVPVALTRRRA